MKCSAECVQRFYFAPSGVPRSADHKRGGSQSACQHPELVQEGSEAVPQSRARRGALPLPRCVFVCMGFINQTY